MNKSVRLLVWVLLSTLLFSGFIVAQRAFGVEPTYKTLSHEYYNTFRDMLRNKIQSTIRYNMPVVLYLDNGSEVRGIYKGYSKYDDSIWIKEYTHWFQTGYGIDEVKDISMDVKEPV